MSIMTVDLIMEKIKIATPESPIAVFKCDIIGQLDAVFAETVETRRVIRSAEKQLVGVYHKGMELSCVEKFLHEIAGGNS